MPLPCPSSIIESVSSSLSSFSSSFSLFDLWEGILRRQWEQKALQEHPDLSDHTLHHRDEDSDDGDAQDCVTMLGIMRRRKRTMMIGLHCHGENEEGVKVRGKYNDIYMIIYI